MNFEKKEYNYSDIYLIYFINGMVYVYVGNRVLGVKVEGAKGRGRPKRDEWITRKSKWRKSI